MTARDKRCGTCKLWKPNPKRDATMDRHFGKCTAPEPRLPACFDRSISERWQTAHSTGTDCPAWKAGGQHGVLA